MQQQTPAGAGWLCVAVLELQAISPRHWHAALAGVLWLALFSVPRGAPCTACDQSLQVPFCIHGFHIPFLPLASRADGSSACSHALAHSWVCFPPHFARGWRHSSTCGISASVCGANNSSCCTYHRAVVPFQRMHCCANRVHEPAQCPTQEIGACCT